MLTEKIIDAMFLPVYGLLGLLPNVELSIESSMFNNFLEVVRMAGYLLPINTVFLILSLIIALQMLTIMIALIRTIWKFIPLIGG